MIIEWIQIHDQLIWPQKNIKTNSKLSTKIVIFASISEHTEQANKKEDKTFIYDSEMLTLNTPF
jgi:hypothetical protein